MKGYDMRTVTISYKNNMNNNTIYSIKTTYIFNQKSGVLYTITLPFVDRNSCVDFKILDKSAVLFFSLFDGKNTYKDVLDYLQLLFQVDKFLLIQKIDNFLNKYSYVFTTDKTCMDKKAQEYLLKMPVPPIDYRNKRFIYPISLLLLLTKKCDKKCVYCIYNANHMGANAVQDLPLSFFMGLHRQAVDTGVKSINYSGGEPLLYHNIEHLIYFDKENQIESSITTKGGPSLKKVEEVCRAGLSSATLSLDSPDAATVDYLLNSNGAYRQLLQTLKMLVRYNVNLRINMVANKLNFTQVPQMVAICKEYGVSHLSIRECKDGFGRSKKSLFLSDEEIQRVEEQSREFQSDSFSINFVRDCANSESKLSFCRSGKMNMIVRHDGKVVMCEDVIEDDDTVLGDLKNNTLQEVWNSKMMLNFINPPRESYGGTDCQKCAKFNSCVKTQCVYKNLKTNNRLYLGVDNCPYKE